MLENITYQKYLFQSNCLLIKKTRDLSSVGIVRQVLLPKCSEMCVFYSCVLRVTCTCWWRIRASCRRTPWCGRVSITWKEMGISVTRNSDCVSRPRRIRASRRRSRCSSRSIRWPPGFQFSERSSEVLCKISEWWKRLILGHMTFKVVLEF